MIATFSHILGFLTYIKLKSKLVVYSKIVPKNSSKLYFILTAIQSNQLRILYDFSGISGCTPDVRKKYGN